MLLEVLNSTHSAQRTAILGVESPLEASGIPCHLESSHAADTSHDESEQSQENTLQALLPRQTQVTDQCFAQDLSC